MENFGVYIHSCFFHLIHYPDMFASILYFIYRFGFSLALIFSHVQHV